MKITSECELAIVDRNERKSDAHRIRILLNRSANIYKILKWETNDECNGTSQMVSDGNKPRSEVYSEVLSQCGIEGRRGSKIGLQLISGSQIFSCGVSFLTFNLHSPVREVIYSPLSAGGADSSPTGCG